MVSRIAIVNRGEAVSRPGVYSMRNSQHPTGAGRTARRAGPLSTGTPTATSTPTRNRSRKSKINIKGSCVKDRSSSEPGGCDYGEDQASAPHGGRCDYATPSCSPGRCSALLSRRR